jgi:hypothetical protein
MGWNQDDFDEVEGGVIVGRIFNLPANGSGEAGRSTPIVLRIFWTVAEVVLRKWGDCTNSTGAFGLKTFLDQA